MKLRLLICTILLTCFSVTSYGDQNPKSEVHQSEKYKAAIVTTQVLASTICGEHANLDPKVLAKESSAFLFLAALEHIALANADAEFIGLFNPKDPSDKTLANKMKFMKCDQAGILQYEAPYKDASR